MTKWTGELSLSLEDRGGRTVARNVYFQGAFKVMRPIYHDDSGMVCYYLLNPGGGYLDGDRYRMDITVDSGARVTLTTQSATKVYKTPTDHAQQETTITLRAGSYLEFLPDPLIAYRDAHYRQKNIVHMEKGATFLYTDILTPGWSPDGGKFTYNTVQLINEIYLDGEPAIFDHIKLVPSAQTVSGLGFMEGYTHLGSMIAVGEQTTDELIDALHDLLESTRGEKEVKFGISRLAVPGFSIRILASKTGQIEKMLAACHRKISEEWLGLTPASLRKY
ncbi:urease accessory protein UreD [Sporosarcina sp. FSL W7-1349]|uniref:urease accessory protein UreD n=1 Tax=Sporosarcina sp. FSL W7-1349 TaxID=2921561 RepID=UPI0030FD0354